MIKIGIKQFLDGHMVVCLLTTLLLCNIGFAQNSNVKKSKSEQLIIAFPLAGFYLVSLPVAVGDSSVSNLFPMAIGAFTWEIDRYVSATTISRGRGYWLAIPEPSVAIIEGTPITQYSIHFTPGWHLIGSVLDTVDFSQPNDDPDGSVILPLFRWNTAEKRYDASTTIEQSHGYWMAVLQESDLIVTGDTTTSVAELGSTKLSKPAFVEQFGSDPPPPPFDLVPELGNLSPQEPVLLSNYPNPFNPETQIEFRVLEFGLVNLIIYDVLGREVVTLLKKSLQPGNHSVRWNGRDGQGNPASSGVYFYRIITNSFSDTKKMILIR